MKLIDNVNTRLGEDLKETIKKGSKLSIAATTFSICAFEALKKLGKIDELRFILVHLPSLKRSFKRKAESSTYRTLFENQSFAVVSLN